MERQLRSVKVQRSVMNPIEEPLVGSSFDSITHPPNISNSCRMFGNPRDEVIRSSRAESEWVDSNHDNKPFFLVWSRCIHTKRLVH